MENDAPDRALFALITDHTSDPDLDHTNFKFITGEGPLTCDAKTKCAAWWEYEAGGWDSELIINYQGQPKGFYVWEGKITYCDGYCSYEGCCDCGPEFEGELRPATLEDLRSFGFGVE